jgi:hypothetical protein
MAAIAAVFVKVLAPYACGSGIAEVVLYMNINSNYFRSNVYCRDL